ncbi:YqaJ viral recombinase family protein [Altererythrobacter sp. HHU K3-1]|uniref:YqaJ viral recombinase family protein n=1 Tax=Qipengyuania atrilutea TaxID=2744473 RepID=A0A850H5F0_9SPHN|nr:YqaJ viral recombinase family protein [Actirhodobacter atriluteus]
MVRPRGSVFCSVNGVLGYSASRANYMAQLVAERLTGAREEGYINAAMQRGIDLEAQARAMYEFHTGNTVTETGFTPHPSIAMCGASPDGLVGEDGLVEIKVPNTATHIATLRGGKVDDRYVKQMHLQMLCTGRKWCDFVSFDDRLPDEMALHIERIELDVDLAAEMEAEIAKFLTELDETVADLEARYLQQKAA